MDIWHFHSGHVNRGFGCRLAHFPRSLATAAALGILLVCCKIKAYEQQEVTAEDTHPSKGCKFLPSARSHAWHVWEVRTREIGVRSEIDEEQIDDELHDLQHRDVFFPPDLDSSSRLEVIPIHHNVDE